jgi:multiple sugar transport system permease protein
MSAGDDPSRAGDGAPSREGSAGPVGTTVRTARRPVPPARVAALVLVGAGVVLLAAPFWFTFVFATQARADIFASPPPVWFGTHFLSNVQLLLERLPFWRNLGMSLYVACMTTALNLLLCALAGYAFAVHEFAGKKILFALVVGSMMLPSFLNMIPNFMVMDLLGWIDTPRALYVPGAAGALGIFLMRQYIG